MKVTELIMMNKINKYLPHPYISIVFILSFIFIYFNAKPIMHDPDIPWHLAAGKEIISLGHIPDVNHRGLIEQNEWHNISWLWDIIIATIEINMGLDYVYLFSALIASLSIALISYIASKRIGMVRDPIMITATMVTLCILFRIYPRPEIISYSIAAIFYYELYKFNSNINRRNSFIILPILMVIWVNMHGSFIAGLIMLAAYFLGSIKEEDNIKAKKIFILGAITGVATFINPKGIFIVESTLMTLNNPITHYINEWKGFSYGTDIGMSLFLLVFIIFSNFRHKEICYGERLLVFFWLAFSLYSMRNFALFAVISASYIAVQIKNTIEIKKYDSIDTKRNRRYLTLASIIIPITLSLPVSIDLMHGGMVHGDSRKAPIEAIKYLEENYSDKKIINGYNIGGFMVYYSNLPIFVDGRAGTAYSNEVIEDVINLFITKEDLEETFNKYDFEVAILLKSNPLYKNLIAREEEWKEVFTDETANTSILEKIVMK